MGTIDSSGSGTLLSITGGLVSPFTLILSVFMLPLRGLFWIFISSGFLWTVGFNSCVSDRRNARIASLFFIYCQGGDSSMKSGYAFNPMSLAAPPVKEEGWRTITRPTLGWSSIYRKTFWLFP
jgi:hypothetical protein